MKIKPSIYTNKNNHKAFKVIWSYVAAKRHAMCVCKSYINSTAYWLEAIVRHSVLFGKSFSGFMMAFQLRATAVAAEERSLWQKFVSQSLKSALDGRSAGLSTPGIHWTDWFLLFTKSQIAVCTKKGFALLFFRIEHHKNNILWWQKVWAAASALQISEISVKMLNIQKIPF